MPEPDVLARGSVDDGRIAGGETLLLNVGESGLEFLLRQLNRVGISGSFEVAPAVAVEVDAGDDAIPTQTTKVKIINTPKAFFIALSSVEIDYKISSPRMT